MCWWWLMVCFRGDPMLCGHPDAMTARGPCASLTSVSWETAAWSSPYSHNLQWHSTHLTAVEPRGQRPFGRNLFMRHRWHSWLSNLWDVFGIFSQASCMAWGMATSDLLLFHRFVHTVFPLEWIALKKKRKKKSTVVHSVERTKSCCHW